MKKYKIKINYPGWYTTRGIENTATIRMNNTKDVAVIYDAVAEFEESVFKIAKSRLEKNRVQNRIKIIELLKINDITVIKNIRLIKRMLVSFRDGRHALTTSGMPNVKILKTKNNKLYLFDGHHSVLAYMAAGNRYLHQLPYMQIENKDEKRILDDNLRNFFGEHLKWKRRDGWQNYTINWQARGRKKLQVREQKNMGELFNVIQRQYNF